MSSDRNFRGWDDYVEVCKQNKALRQQVATLTQERDNYPVCCCIIKDDKLVKRCKVHADDAEAQAQKYKEERDEWMQQAEHRRVIIRDRKAQVQKYKDKLTRCSAMFDEVENALADSCRREGKLKGALEKYGNHLPNCNSHKLRIGRCSFDEELYMDCSCGFQALQVDSKEDMELCPECGDRAVVLGADYNTCTSCRDEDVVFVPSKDMVLVPREDIFKLEQARLNLYALFPEADTNLIVNLSYVSGPMWKITKGRLPVKIKAAEKPDLSKCPGCGGLADNGHDRCDPPNVYSCTKCTKSEDKTDGKG